MKSLSCAILALAFVAATLPASAAPAEKSLQNIRGTVSHGLVAAGTDKQPLAPQASIALADAEYAFTGPNSQAAISFPDSSRVIVGMSTTLQLKSFNQTDMAHASFVVIDGKMRFTVQHPAGARADYQFSTPIGQIAVRGTVGDIAYTNNDTLQVNVYDLTDPSLPVMVTLATGQVYYLGKGDVLVAHRNPDNTVSVKQRKIDQPHYDPFKEFGLPQNARELGLLPTGGAALGIGGLGLVAIPIVILAGSHGGGNSPSTQPTAAPAGPPTVPITITSETPKPKPPL